MSDFEDWLARAARRRDAVGLTRRTLTRPAREMDRRVLDLAGNDYLGLADHPRVIAGAIEATELYGTGATASRLVTGTLPIHEQLETALTQCTGAESALVFSTGYQANLGVVTALSGPDALLVSDAHVHASLVDACRLARGTVQVVPHNDFDAVDAALAQRSQPRALVLVETIYSVLGDAAPLARLAEICHRHRAVLIADEAHALGVAGPRGAGLLAAEGLLGDSDVIATVTLSKALGAQGGAVLGSRLVREHLVNRNRRRAGRPRRDQHRTGASRSRYRCRGPAGGGLPGPASGWRGVVGADARPAGGAGGRSPGSRGRSADRLLPPALDSGPDLPAADHRARPAHRRRAGARRRRTRNGVRVMKVVVVTGTDTGVGKTVAVAALTATLAAAGRQVAVVKPVQTGLAADEPGDIAEVTRLAGAVPAYELHRLGPALAPAAAARVSGQPLPPVAAHRDAVLQIAGDVEVTVVEGAGGLLVPYDAVGGTLADLAIALRDAGADLHVVLVVRAGLGTLNHTALTVEALLSRGLGCAGLVIGSWPRRPDLAMRQNLLDLPEVSGVPLLGRIPARAARLAPATFRAKAPGWLPADHEVLA